MPGDVPGAIEEGLELPSRQQAGPPPPPSYLLCAPAPILSDEGGWGRITSKAFGMISCGS